MLISLALLGLLSSLDPLRPVVFVYLLRTAQGRLNAIGFFIGWALALAALFTIAFTAFSAGQSGRPSPAQQTWLSIVELLLAVVLGTMALRRWRRRHDTAAPYVIPAPVSHQLDHLTPRRSGILGVLLQPRALTIAAAVIVAREHSGITDALLGLAVFALVSTGALLGMFTFFIRRPEQADSWLADVGDRIEQAGPMIFTCACALGGAYMLFQGLQGLITG